MLDKLNVLEGIWWVLSSYVLSGSTVPTAANITLLKLKTSTIQPIDIFEPLYQALRDFEKSSFRVCRSY